MECGAVYYNRQVSAFWRNLLCLSDFRVQLLLPWRLGRMFFWSICMYHIPVDCNRDKITWYKIKLGLCIIKIQLCCWLQCSKFSIAFLMFCLNPRRWFVLCLACIPYLMLVQVSRETGTSSVDWAQLSKFYMKTETESSFWNAVFWIKTGWWITSRNVIFVLPF
jgi:hypothetical protein